MKDIDYRNAYREGANETCKELYEWLMDENREPSQTKFTSGTVRNLAKEIEFRIKNKK